jgi:hypothetical protein
MHSYLYRGLDLPVLLCPLRPVGGPCLSVQNWEGCVSYHLDLLYRLGRGLGLEVVREPHFPVRGGTQARPPVSELEGWWGFVH